MAERSSLYSHTLARPMGMAWAAISVTARNAIFVSTPWTSSFLAKPISAACCASIHSARRVLASRRCSITIFLVDACFVLIRAFVRAPALLVAFFSLRRLPLAKAHPLTDGNSLARTNLPRLVSLQALQERYFYRDRLESPAKSLNEWTTGVGKCPDVINMRQFSRKYDTASSPGRINGVRLD